jgi:hypothetical protein
MRILLDTSLLVEGERRNLESERVSPTINNRDQQEF